MPPPLRLMKCYTFLMLVSLSSASTRRASSIQVTSTLLSPDAYKTLATNANLLHLLHHRNRNQHRRCIWYRHFLSLRRELNRLLSVVSLIQPEGPTSINRIKNQALASSPAVRKRPRRRAKNLSVDRATQLLPDNAKSKRAQRLQAEERIRSRLSFWLEADLVAKWHAAFSQLTHHIQYAPLGIILLAILARVCDITGLTAAYMTLAGVEEEGNAERLRAALHRFERDTNLEELLAHGISDEQHQEGRPEDLDLGVVIDRERMKLVEAPWSPSEVRMENDGLTQNKVVEAPKRRRKPLFGN